MDLAYANGKLWSGVELLATEPGRIQQRLRTAWLEFFARVDAGSLPEGELRSEWAGLLARVTRGGANFAAITEMDDAEAVDVARDVMRIQGTTRQILLDGQR